jgi:hypothetical protein
MTDPVRPILFLNTVPPVEADVIVRVEARSAASLKVLPPAPSERRFSSPRLRDVALGPFGEAAGCATPSQSADMQRIASILDDCLALLDLLVAPAGASK